MLVLLLMLGYSGGSLIIAPNTDKDLSPHPNCMAVPGFCVTYLGTAKESGKSIVDTFEVQLPQTPKNFNTLFTHAELFKASNNSGLQALSEQLISTHRAWKEWITETEEYGLIPRAPSGLGIRTPRGIITSTVLAGLGMSALLGIGVGGGYLHERISRQQQESDSLGGLVLELRNRTFLDLQIIEEQMSVLRRDVQHADQKLRIRIENRTEFLERKITETERKLELALNILSRLTALQSNINDWRGGLKSLALGNVPTTFLSHSGWTQLIQSMKSQVGEDYIVKSNEPKLVSANYYPSSHAIRVTILLQTFKAMFPGFAFHIVPTPSMTSDKVILSPFDSKPFIILADSPSGVQDPFLPTTYTGPLEEEELPVLADVIKYKSPIVYSRYMLPTCFIPPVVVTCTDILLHYHFLPPCRNFFLNQMTSLRCAHALPSFSLSFIQLPGNFWYIRSPGGDISIRRNCRSKQSTDVKPLSGCANGCLIMLKCDCFLQAYSKQFTFQRTLAPTSDSCAEKPVIRTKRTLTRLGLNIRDIDPSVPIQLEKTPFLNLTYRELDFTRFVRELMSAETNITQSSYLEGLKGSLMGLKRLFKHSPLTGGVALVSGFLASIGAIFALFICIRSFRKSSVSGILLSRAHGASASPTSIVQSTAGVFIGGFFLGFIVLFIVWLIYKIWKIRATHYLSTRTPFATPGQLVSRNLGDVINHALPILTGTDLLPVTRYPHIVNLSIKRSEPETGCIAVILLKGQLSSRGTICFTTGLFEIGCKNRNLLENVTVETSGVQLIRSVEDGLLKGMVMGIKLGWVNRDNSEQTPRSAEITIQAGPLFITDSTFSIVAVGVRCVKCGGIWFSYSDPPSSRPPVYKPSPGALLTKEDFNF